MSEESSPSKGKGKMMYQYDKELSHTTLSQVSSSYDGIKDTKIGHVDLLDFLRRIETSCQEEML